MILTFLTIILTTMVPYDERYHSASIFAYGSLGPAVVILIIR
jgi:hypothetical protein